MLKGDSDYFFVKAISLFRKSVYICTRLKEGRRQKAEGRRQKAEGRRQKAEGRRQKAEGRRQKAEGRRQKAEISNF